MNETDYLREACRYAAERSDDPSTQNGAVLVSGTQLIYAANRFPTGVAVTGERLERPLKYSFMEHAERGVIYAAAAAGVPTAGATLYCPWFACADCARAIICAGIREVVGLSLPMDDQAAKRWAENVEKGLSMLTEAGVIQRWMTCEMGVTLLRDGGHIRV
jgi:dCMP deaminase